jgi:hydroxyacylglutathione hydrolase
LKELETAKIDPQEISYLVLTHHHDDHVGFARKFLLNSQARLIVHNNALPFLGKGIHDNRREHWNWWIHQLISPFSKILNHKYPPLNVRKDDIILHNDSPKTLLDLGLDGELISAPGHSSDSISIVLDDGNAIVGDVAMNLLNFGETKYRPFFIQDIEEIFRSRKKLIKFGTRTVYPSHGRPFSVEKLIRNLRFAEKMGICG